MSHNYRDGGKGDMPRPFSVNLDKFSENFDAIFGKKEKQKPDNKKEQDEHKTDSKE